MRLLFVPLVLCSTMPFAQAAPLAASASNKPLAKSAGQKRPARKTAAPAASKSADSKSAAAATKKAGAAKGGKSMPAKSKAAPKKVESKLDILWRQADEAFHHGDYEKSIALHKQVVALDPHDAQSFGVAAWLMWSLGRGDEAIAHLRRGVAGDPKNWEMWKELGENTQLQKRWQDSQDAYTRAVALMPKAEDSQMLRRSLAHAAEKAGDLPTSIATWRALTKDFPGEPVNHNNLARVEKALANPPATEAIPSGNETPEASSTLLAGAGLLSALLLPALFRR